MTDFYDWSTAAVFNASADSNINFAEFQDPSTVNDSARALMARIAEWRADLAPTRTSTGSANAYVVASVAGGTGAYRDGEIVTFIADRANTGACTLNVNFRGAKSFRPAVGIAFSSGEIQANAPIIAFYRASSDEFLAVGSGYAVTAMTTGLLSQSIAARLIKIGTPVLSIAPTAPAGYIRLTESTQTLNKSDWPELSSWLSGLSTPYPWGSTSTTFSLPPAAGYVLRFASTSASIDTSGARTAGSTQSDQNKAHTHTPGTLAASAATTGAHTHSYVNSQAGSGDIGSGSAFARNSPQTTGSNGDHTHTITLSGATASDGGDEVRVKNVAMHVDIFASSTLSAGTLAMFGFPFAWDTGTTAADPGTARVRGNNATLASITSLYISETDAWGINLQTVLLSIASGTMLKISKVGAQSNTLVFTCNGAVTDNGAYFTIPVTVSASGGSFSNSDTVAFEMSAPSATGTTAAASTQTDQETSTSTTTYVSPGVQQYHPSAAKAWVKFNTSGAVLASYNITSVTDNGIGNWTVNIGNDFSSSNYCGIATSGAYSAGSLPNACSVVAMAAGTFQIIAGSTTGGFLDPDTPAIVCAAFFGDQ